MDISKHEVTLDLSTVHQLNSQLDTLTQLNDKSINKYIWLAIRGEDITIVTPSTHPVYLILQTIMTLTKEVRDFYTTAIDCNIVSQIKGDTANLILFYRSVNENNK